MADKTPHYNMNTISRGFASGGSYSSSLRKYARHVLTINLIYLLLSRGCMRGKIGVNMTFYKEDALRLNPHDNDPTVIIVQHSNWDVKRVLIDLGSSADVLFRDAFNKLHLDSNEVNVFSDSLTRLSCKQVQVMSHTTLNTTLAREHMPRKLMSTSLLWTPCHRTILFLGDPL